MPGIATWGRPRAAPRAAPAKLVVPTGAKVSEEALMNLGGRVAERTGTEVGDQSGVRLGTAARSPRTEVEPLRPSVLDDAPEESGWSATVEHVTSKSLEEIVKKALEEAARKASEGNRQFEPSQPPDNNNNRDRW